MPPAIKSIIEQVDRAALVSAIDDLRHQLEACEELLAALVRFETGEAANSNGRVSAAQKRELMLAIMRERVGPWSTREVREALNERGIDTHTGTPIKNLLWNLAKEGLLDTVSTGTYQIAALSGSAEIDRKGALAA
jgi:hypothetical protein